MWCYESKRNTLVGKAGNGRVRMVREVSPKRREKPSQGRSYDRKSRCLSEPTVVQRIGEFSSKSVSCFPTASSTESVFFLLPSFRLLQKDSSLRKRWLCDKSQSPNWICDDRTDSNGIGVSPRAVLCNHTPPVSLCRICLLCWYVVSCSCVVCEGKNLLSGLDDGRTRLNG